MSEEKKEFKGLIYMFAEYRRKEGRYFISWGLSGTNTKDEKKIREISNKIEIMFNNYQKSLTPPNKGQGKKIC